MENRGLLFIPDISGFTKFVTETEINHSRLIIQELLELLLNANQLDLAVSEVEGDAILFYQFGDPPSLLDIYSQVQQMFISFHRQLVAYEYRRYCQCQACISAINLTLKVITHYGEFTGYNIKNFQKLIGKDVIIAHQLLKNNIELHEYWLVSDNLLENEPPRLANWMQWNSSVKQTESGPIAFRYTQLSQLRKEIKPEPLPQLHLSKKTKVLTISAEYPTDIITLFHATGDLNYRSLWQQGVKTVEELTHFLPRVGMRGRCIMENGEVTIFSSSYSFSQQRIEFSETTERGNRTTYFTLEKMDELLTRLTVDVYIPANFFEHFLFRLREKKALEDMWQQSLSDLTEALKKVRLPGR
jgi:hypothetical protein